MEHRDAGAGREPHGQRLGGHRQRDPGKKHNTVLASANNAETVTDYADTRLRVLAQRRVIPPVTG